MFIQQILFSARTYLLSNYSAPHWLCGFKQPPFLEGRTLISACKSELQERDVLSGSSQCPQRRQWKPILAPAQLLITQGSQGGHSSPRNVPLFVSHCPPHVTCRVIHCSAPRWVLSFCKRGFFKPPVFAVQKFYFKIQPTSYRFCPLLVLIMPTVLQVFELPFFTQLCNLHSFSFLPY